MYNLGEIYGFSSKSCYLRPSSNLHERNVITKDGFTIRAVFERERDCERCTNNFYRREKSIAFYNVTMSYCFQKPKFQHSVTTTYFFARFFSVKAISLQPVRENLIKLRIFGFFFFKG